MGRLVNIEARIKKYEKVIDPEKLAAVGFKAFVAATPRVSGRAQNSTTLSGHTINANYPYAKQLERGSSKQSPKGMTEPAHGAIQTHIEQVLGSRFKGK